VAVSAWPESGRDISVAAVVRATEPHQNLVECFDARTNTCPIDGACGLKHALVRAQQAFFSELEQYSLADFTPRAPALIKLWNRNLKEAPA
jgi:Rrf2 family transcriptional regulator, nitric oxide-sensitive transcriptional repressor